MSTDAEYERKKTQEAGYRRNIRTYEGKISTEQGKIDRLEEEIYRLECAYDRLDNLEGGTAKDLKKGTKVKNISSGYGWRGENKDKFDSMFDSDINPNAGELKKYVDSLKDTINLKISEKQSQIYQSQGLIGSFRASINSLYTRIRNLFN